MKKIELAPIIEIINDAINNETEEISDIDKDLMDAGMDSITFIQVVLALEEYFECEIPDSKLLLSELNTVNKIYGTLRSINDDSN